MDTNPEQRRKRSGIKLFTIFGIDITLDLSWFIIFLLVIWSLSAGYFPREFPGQTAQVYWFAGLLATLFFFLSILAHELAHSLVAQRMGIPIPEIRLFVFGGVASISEEAKDPQTEIKIALAGPLMSFLLAGGFWILYTIARGTGPKLIIAVLEYLAYINVALGVFNLIPGFPLDGGRLLRAVIWWRSGSLTKGTRIAADAGKGLAVVLMIFGGINIFGGNLIGGLWFVFIGMFLRGIAQGGYQQVLMSQTLEGRAVKELMIRDVECVPPGITLQELGEAYFLRCGYHGFPVERDGAPLGIVSLSHLKEVPHEERGIKRVEAVMHPRGPEIEVTPDTALEDALKKMNQSDVERLLVMENDQMVGLITKTRLLRFLEVKKIMAS